MRQLFLQLVSLLIYKMTKYQTATFKALKAEHKRKKAEYKKKADALQAMLDEEHRSRFGWDSYTLKTDLKAPKAKI